MTVESAPSPAQLEAQVRDIMSGTFWRDCGRHQRTVFAAGKFAELFADASRKLAASDSREGVLLAKWRADFKEAIQSPSFYHLESRWAGADYIYNDYRGENTVADIRRLSILLDHARLLAPDYSPSLKHHVLALRDALVESERDGQAAVRRAVQQERKKALAWRMPMSALAVAGIVYLWGRPLGWWVAIGFAACLGVLQSWTRAENRDAEVARRCKEIGWPLQT